jgi:opacity protein-like surface antigen
LKTFSRFAVAALLLTATAAQAETFDLNISDEAVRAALSGPLRIGTTGQARYDVGYLYSDDRDARLNAVHAGFLVTGDAGARDADAYAGLGIRAVGIDTRGGSGLAIMIGGEFELRLPDFNRLGLVGYGYIAPSVLAFSDVERYSEWALSIDYEVVRNASLYLGYRQVRAGLKDIQGGNGRTIDSSPHLGLRLKF